MHWDNETDSIPFPLKLIGLAVVALFAFIGVVGLILPIIPGILFLALAAFIMAKLSSRFAYFLDDQPIWQRLKRQWHSTRVLTVVEKTKLMALYIARSAIDGVDNLIRAIKSRID